jgi:hypothetical protein
MRVRRRAAIHRGLDKTKIKRTLPVSSSVTSRGPHELLHWNNRRRRFDRHVRLPHRARVQPLSLTVAGVRGSRMRQETPMLMMDLGLLPVLILNLYKMWITAARSLGWRRAFAVNAVPDVFQRLRVKQGQTGDAGQAERGARMEHSAHSFLMFSWDRAAHGSQPDRMCSRGQDAGADAPPQSFLMFSKAQMQKVLARARASRPSDATHSFLMFSWDHAAHRSQSDRMCPRGRGRRHGPAVRIVPDVFQSPESRSRRKSSSHAAIGRDTIVPDVFLGLRPSVNGLGF